MMQNSKTGLLGNISNAFGGRQGLLSAGLPMVFGNSPQMQQQALMQGLQFGGQMQAENRKTQKAEAQRNKTLEYLSKTNPKLAAMVQAGMPIKDAWSQAIKAQAPNNGATYGKSPVYGTDPTTGQTILGVVGDDGSFKKLETGDFKVANGFQKIDTGTEIMMQDKRTGQIVSVTPKQNEQAAFDKGRGSVLGKEAGDAQVRYDSVTSKMEGLNQVVQELGKLAETATYTMAGRSKDYIAKELGMDPSQGAQDRAKYAAIVDNQVLPLLRDTFGAAFTVVEGERLRATLGDENKSPAEKQAVLEAFIQQKYRDVQAMQNQLGIQPQQPIAQPAPQGMTAPAVQPLNPQAPQSAAPHAPAPVAQPAPVPDFSQMTDEELEAFINES